MSRRGKGFWVRAGGVSGIRAGAPLVSVFALALALAIAGPASARRDAPPSPASSAQPEQAVDPATDPSFNAALPPLDSVQAPPATTTAAPSGPLTPSASVTPPVANDPELAQPLPPLAGFDPTPDTSKAAVPTTEETRIRYTMKVEGLKKIGLEDEFRSLSELENGRKKAANAAQVTARAKDDEQLATKLLRSEGYFDGVASSTVAPVPNEPGHVTATISVTPGPRYTLSNIQITGAEPEPTGIAGKALAPQVKVGDPIRSIAITGGEAQISLALPQQGYPFAKVGDRDVLIDGDAHTGDYTLPLSAGPRSSFGRVRTDGKGARIFSEKHLAVFPRFKPGDLYDSRKTDDLRQALVATGIFSTVAIQPVDTGQKAADGTEITDLLVTQRKGPWRSWAAQGGYGTGQGIKGEVTWTHRNLFSPEGALILGVIGGTQEQGANAIFRRSNAGRRDKTFQITGGFDRSNYDAYDAKSINLGVNWSRQSTPIWQKLWTYSYGVELVGTNEQGAATDPTGDRPRRNYLIAALPVQVQYDRSNDLLNPTKGFRATARVSPEASVRKGVKGYGRLTGQLTGYFPIGQSIVLAGRALVSSIVGVNDVAEIAPSRRIYVGGGGSVRGFGYQELGPKDAQNNPIGGLSSTEFAAEVRYRFGNFGVVPFFDMGRLGEKSMPSLSGLRYGAGIGGRYYTNFGPLRVDVATPINRQRGESKIALYISIGQAF
jgi:translocation and assembly module TamA